MMHPLHWYTLFVAALCQLGSQVVVKYDHMCVYRVGFIQCTGCGVMCVTSVCTLKIMFRRMIEISAKSAGWTILFELGAIIM